MKNKVDIEKILPLVQRPVRYIDHEWNSRRKTHDDRLASFCLCFPDLYEIGGSNLGIEILYQMLNKNDNAFAERCYMPASDMERQMRERKIPLFSLESNTAVKDFDIVGIGLQYELCATNVLNLLDLAGLPLFSKDRSDIFPIVIGGGPQTLNPEPLADFFDAFVLGDGEDAVIRIAETVKKMKPAVKSKSELLSALSKIEGVYIPSFYDVKYAQDGTIESIVPNQKGVPEAVKKGTVNLKSSFFPTEKIVPYMETVHNRINVEIARGCPRNCRFCSAARYYSPWRIRDPKDVLNITDKSITSTGIGEVSFSSLSCTDHSGIGELLSAFNKQYADKRINISLPSLRCDKFSLDIAKDLDINKKSNLTFAPEAGTDRLRTVIGKYLSDAQITETLLLAASSGWQTIKLYFMIGLPTETEDDIEGINRLVRGIKKQAHRLNFNVSLSPYVPKPQTPFQWVAMDKEENLRNKMIRLKKSLPASVKGNFTEPSVLEAVIARGDRKLAGVIYRAWQKGARFEQWKEQFDFGVWRKAFEEEKIDYGFYIYRERKQDEKFPWDHIDFGMSKEELYKSYLSAFSNDLKPDNPKDKPFVPSGSLRTIRGASKVFQKVRARFSRKGILRFLSHLEQIELVRSALRRSGLPLAYSEGFSPQPKVSFGPAISVGYESESEYAEISFEDRVEPDELNKKINASLPEGYSLMSVKRVPLFFPSFDSLVNVAYYKVECPATSEQIEKFLSANEIIVEKKKEKKTLLIDVKPLIIELKANDGFAYIKLRFGPKHNIKPEKIIQKLCSLDENSAKMLSVTRLGFLIEKKDGSIIEP